MNEKCVGACCQLPLTCEDAFAGALLHQIEPTISCTYSELNACRCELKSDIYSFGVVLWEVGRLAQPHAHLEAMRVQEPLSSRAPGGHRPSLLPGLCR